MTLSVRQAALVSIKVDQLEQILKIDPETIEAMRAALAVAMFAAGITAAEVNALIERSKG